MYGFLFALLVVLILPPSASSAVFQFYTGDGVVDCPGGVSNCAIEDAQDTTLTYQQGGLVLEISPLGTATGVIQDTQPAFGGLGTTGDGTDNITLDEGLRIELIGGGKLGSVRFFDHDHGETNNQFTAGDDDFQLWIDDALIGAYELVDVIDFGALQGTRFDFLNVGEDPFYVGSVEVTAPEPTVALLLGLGLALVSRKRRANACEADE